MASKENDELKNSMMQMQAEMQKAYSSLADEIITGESKDKTVTIKMTATYDFQDIDFKKDALQGGISEFRWRIREAWKDLSKKIQETTQSRTMELLQGVDIPDEIKKITDEKE